MAAQAWTKAKLFVTGNTLTTYVQGVTLEYSAEMLDQSEMNTPTRKFFPGMKNWTITAQLKHDTAGTLDGLLYAWVGATAGVDMHIQPLATTNVSDANPRYRGTGHLEGYTPAGGSVGDLRVTTVTFRSGSALTRTTAT
jgi:hypothetical protein